MFDLFLVWFKGWGPGLVISVVLLFGLYKIAIKLGEKLGGKILDALEKPAAALDKQAEAINRLSDSLREYVTRDQVEHREMIVLQKIIMEKIDLIKGEKNG